MALASRQQRARRTAEQDRSAAPVDLGARFADVTPRTATSDFVSYDARDLEADRAVTVKLPVRDAGPWLHEMLGHEAAVLAAVGSHPNIITLYDHVAVPDGRRGLVLEHCPRSLADDLTGGDALAVETAVAIGIKLAGALETVHRAGFVHGDVRPDNVLVSEWDQPALSSFTEAVRPDADSGTASHVTTAHTAPELLEGLAPTAAADVYGLASTLYELVAGRAAFRAYAGESAATVIVRVLSNKVKPIVAPGIPLEMSDLLTWAMSPNPKSRPPTPSWIAEELSRIERREGWPRTRMLSR